MVGFASSVWTYSMLQASFLRYSQVEGAIIALLSVALHEESIAAFQESAFV